jgi:DNA mismatch repair ATPase MutS
MMDFLVDYQTVSDLQIFPDEKADMSVYKLFDHAKTHGGKARLKNIRFYFFDAEAKNDIPTYTYQVKERITNTRLGMYIIRKEKILETIARILID